MNKISTFVLIINMAKRNKINKYKSKTFVIFYNFTINICVYLVQHHLHNKGLIKKKMMFLY
jgi:hypothetical protein